MKAGWDGTLEKIDDYRWRIPRSYKPGMRVPGLIYTDERGLTVLRGDQAPEQVANVAFLPGIIGASLAMPDIHWGYGFPIGGVAATDPEAGGVISPGGVGFDINCLTAEARILLPHGCYRAIGDLEKQWKTCRLACMNFSRRTKEETFAKKYIKIKPPGKTFRLRTFSGHETEATADHPFWTEDGMRPLKQLKPGDRVAVYPFEGVVYQEPGDGIIVDEERVKAALKKLNKGVSGNASAQILKYLKSKNLLPLKYDSPALPYLIKTMGYSLGDGNIHFSGRAKKGTCWFWGKKEDLEQIRKDIEKTGFRGSRVYRRTRQHKIKTRYSLVEFDYTENSCKVHSSGFAILLALLGAPVGNKTDRPFSVPEWLFRAPLWQKRLFLAAYFGAEMAAPKTLSEHGYNLYCPVISMNKKDSLAANGRAFFADIARLLSEFGVNVLKISENPEYVSKTGSTNYRIRLILSGKSEDLSNLYRRVGFEYNRERSFLANTAVQFLRYKEKILAERRKAAMEAVALHSHGLSAGGIFTRIGSDFVNRRFIERSVYEGRDQCPRISSAALNFADFLEEKTAGLGQSGMVWDEIVSLEEAGPVDYVYDFTVGHKDHNFIADAFVVSNCGVRLVRTVLGEAEVGPRIGELIRALFQHVPCGLGSSGDIRVNQEEEKKLFIQGARWAVGKGYGVPEDLECTEERGAIPGADPGKASPRAFERGKNQAGTLGSGNHFIEVQVVDEVYDPEAAGVVGLENGRVTVMIHSGSRGFGYQICDDYAKGMVSGMAKFGISVPDRQLACAPVNSPEGKAYLAAMRCAANYAWANRQCLMFLCRQVFERFFNRSWEKLGMNLIYDVAHNIAKIEKHRVDGKEKTLCIHRKGATRAFPPGHPDLPQRYRSIGQPVIIPGDMGRNSYLLTGTEKAAETFYSTCHGAGRLLSRQAAVRAALGRDLVRELKEKGIAVMAAGRETLAEEMPAAYKDVNEVVEVVHNAGISRKVCRMRPLGVIKG